MASTTAKGSGSTVNNGGTVVNAGTPSSDSPITEVLNPNQLATGSEYGSVVLAKDGTTDDYAGVTTADSGGTGGLAYFPTATDRNFIIKAAGDYAAKVNNDANSVLNVPGAEYAGISRDGIHQLNKSVKLGVTSYNVLAKPSSAMVPGRTKGAGAGSPYNYVQVDGSTAATDDAATPTRSVPGELTYMFGGVVPKQDDYKAKNSYES